MKLPRTMSGSGYFHHGRRVSSRHVFTTMNGTASPISLNEVSFYFTRAAVGAGAPFGIGEEFAKASAWLACMGLDPAEAAVPALCALADGKSSGGLILSADHDFIHVQGRHGRRLSAIYAGPVVADRLSIEAGRSSECRLVLEETDQPLLIAAAVAAAEIEAGLTTVSWASPGGERIAVELAGGTVGFVVPDGTNLTASGPARVDVTSSRRAGIATPQSHPAATRLADGKRRAAEHGVIVADVAWREVVGFFRKCLVPSTAQSHSGGAGAGAIDNT